MSSRGLWWLLFVALSSSVVIAGRPCSARADDTPATSSLHEERTLADVVSPPLEVAWESLVWSEAERLARETRNAMPNDPRARVLDATVRLDMSFEQAMRLDLEQVAWAHAEIRRIEGQRLVGEILGALNGIVLGIGVAFLAITVSWDTETLRQAIIFPIGGVCFSAIGALGALVAMGIQIDIPFRWQRLADWLRGAPVFSW